MTADHASIKSSLTPQTLRGGKQEYLRSSRRCWETTLSTKNEGPVMAHGWQHLHNIMGRHSSLTPNKIPFRSALHTGPAGETLLLRTQQSHNTRLRAENRFKEKPNCPWRRDDKPEHKSRHKTSWWARRRMKPVRSFSTGLGPHRAASRRPLPARRRHTPLGAQWAPHPPGSGIL